MAKITLKWPDSIPKSQISVQFIQGMLDRMAMGYHNYGPVTLNFPLNYDAINGVKTRLKHYKKTHNTEFLMDAANFAMIEFMLPADPKAFFKATTKDESPGSPLSSGKMSRGKEDFDPTPKRRV